MFTQLFFQPHIIRKYEDAPLKNERIQVLLELKEQGIRDSVLQRIAIYGVVVAQYIDNFPENYIFSENDIDILAKKWANRKPRADRKRNSEQSKINFKRECRRLLNMCNRLIIEPNKLEQYKSMFDLYFQENEHFSKSYYRNHREAMRNFLIFLENNKIEFANMTIDNLNNYLIEKSRTCSKISQKSIIGILKKWLAFCYNHQYINMNLSAYIMIPYHCRPTSIPTYPTWDTVQFLTNSNFKEEYNPLRNKAILMLLATYSLRPNEITNLLLKDIDWKNKIITIRHSKNHKVDTFNLDVGVGNAIYHYIKNERPQVEMPYLFLRAFAPFNPLTSPGIYNIVANRYKYANIKSKHCGPYGFRHAGAMKLLTEEMPIKSIGDHLGHKSFESVKFYIRLDIEKLRTVYVNLEGVL